MDKIDPAPSSPSEQPTELVGQVLRAWITNVRFDHCNLDLLDEKNASTIAKGRLYQADSLAWENPKLLAELPKYQSGNVLKTVFVRRLRYEDSEALWYVQERWGQRNPWVDLDLKLGDIITGIVVRSITSTKRGEHVGYLVQLDVGVPIQTSDSGIIESCERIQPDIEVFLPDEKLPWKDGNLDTVPTNSKIRRMSLNIGDPIQALVLEIRVPPMDPIVSLTDLINHRDTMSDKEFKYTDNMARWHFWCFLGKTEIPRNENQEIQHLTGNEKLYAGKRLLLVDDNARTLAAQSERLRLIGAKVANIEVRPGSFSEAVREVVATLRENDFDLALIDNNLPGKDLGQDLIGRVRAQLGDEYPVHFALITADSARVPTNDTRTELHAKGVIGFVQRPLTHHTLQRLLTGEEVWEEAKSHLKTDQSEQYLPTTKASPTLQETLDIIAGQPGITFALLVKAKRRIEVEDLITSGLAPFTWDQYPEVLRRTDLVLLIDGKIDELRIVSQKGGNELLHAGRQIHSHWRILELGASRWIFGVGYAPDKDIEGQLPLWRAALATAMDAQGWRDWARHVSGFVQLGLAHQGLSHEVIHLQDEFKNLLFSLARRVEKLELGSKLKKDDKEFILDKVLALTRGNEQLLEFSRRQLRAQALRHRDVFLPEVVTTIKRIVDAECLEAEVALHIIDPPPLVLPLPNATLVLPVVNLLINAAKHHYRRENRRIELLFDLEVKDREEFLSIEVRDNGPGLDQAALERLWQPGFSQATDLDKRHGIGLWLSRQLVEEAGGTLDLHENWRGLGACFRIRFPIHLG